MTTTSNNSVKVSSKVGKELLARLQQTKLGDKLEFDGFMLGLSGFEQPTVAHCTEVEPGKFWEFSLYWCGVHLQKVVAEVQGENLILEACGA